MTLADGILKATTKAFTIKLSRKNMAIMLGGALLVILAGVFAYRLLSESKADLIDSVSRHMILPTNESPAELTIVDSSKIQSQFLKKAQNGDRVLVYQNNQKAIIYRPSVDKIVDVGFVKIDDVSSLKQE